MAKYYYNGVLLPEIPQDVLIEYPYCWIRKNTNTGYYDLIFTKSACYCDGSSLISSVSSNYPYYSILISTAEKSESWENRGTAVSPYPVNTTNLLLVWANYDIPNGSATATDIYFRGSEPVPESGDQESEDTLYFVRRSSLTVIADSIREKTGKTDSLSLTQMATEIDSIEAGIDTTDATATPDGIISGQTAYVSGQKITGSMPDNGAIASTMDGIDIKTITIPAGYTSGGSVSLDDTIDNEVDLQADLIEQITQALQGKAGVGEGLPSVEGGLF